MKKVSFYIIDTISIEDVYDYFIQVVETDKVVSTQILKKISDPNYFEIVYSKNDAHGIEIWDEYLKWETETESS